MRLTYELGHKGSGEYDTDNTKDMPINNIWKAINKLGQLEDIEEEIGFPLVTLYKALKSHIYVKNTQGIRCEGYWSKACLTFGFHGVQGWFFTYKARGCPRFFIKDYGVTWALRKEELEK